MNKGNQQQRIERLRLSLTGLSVGDAFGEMFFDFRRRNRWLENRELPPGPWRYTDDTQMALSIASVLIRLGWIDQNELAQSFAKYYDPERGYGPGMHLFENVKAGESWRPLFASLFGGEGSFGNGASMRVAPVGAYFADDIDAVIENAKLSAQVTHHHPEATAGAIAVAVAAATAYHFRGRAPPTAAEFVDMVRQHVPESMTLDRLNEATKLEPDVSTRKAASILGSGQLVTTQDTVPFVIWVAGKYLTDYQEALWQTVSAAGDMDTTCAMVGGIVSLYLGFEGIPQLWIEQREKLPELPLP